MLDRLPAEGRAVLAASMSVEERLKSFDRMPVSQKAEVLGSLPVAERAFLGAKVPVEMRSAVEGKNAEFEARTAPDAERSARGND